MSLEQPYDINNVFAKIIRGELPCTKVFEDSDTLAFLDLFPQSDGHTLVISKAASAINLFDIDPVALKTLTARVQKTAEAVKTALKPDGIRIMQFNGDAAGQTVFHLHFHIIPVYENKPQTSHASGKPADSALLNKIAETIKAAL